MVGSVVASLTVSEPATDVPTDTKSKSADDSGQPSSECFPDGGREAWIVVLGSSLSLFASAGMVNAYVMQLVPLHLQED